MKPNELASVAIRIGAVFLGARGVVTLLQAFAIDAPFSARGAGVYTGPAAQIAIAALLFAFAAGIARLVAGGVGEAAAPSPAGRDMAGAALVIVGVWLAATALVTVATLIAFSDPEPALAFESTYQLVNVTSDLNRPAWAGAIVQLAIGVVLVARGPRLARPFLDRGNEAG